MGGASFAECWYNFSSEIWGWEVRMSRWRIVGGMGHLLLFGLLATLLGACSAGAAEKPNIVFVLTDDQPRGSLYSMPNTRKLLMEQGRTFENTVNVMPFCCPSRATILSGKYSHNTGVWHNTPPRGGYSVFSQNVSDNYATRLDDRGYQTGYYGRYMHDFDGSSVPPGWDALNVETQPTEATPPPSQREYLNAAGEIAPLPIPNGGTQDSVMANKALGFAKRNAERGTPFLLSVGFEAPHAPAYHEARFAKMFANHRVPRTPAYLESDLSDKPDWVAEKPPLSEQQSNRASSRCREEHATAVGQNDCLYRDMLRSLQTVDAFVGDLVETLRASGDLENTYVFFYSDNGLHLGHHRLAYGKLTPYETDIGFPLLARGPGIAAGSVSRRLVGNHDLAPTLAELGGAEPPGEADGRTLAPVLFGDPAQWRDALLLERETFGGELVKTTPQDVPGYRAVVTEGKKYVEWDTGEKELYDLAADPYELKSIHGSAEEGELSARLGGLAGCAGQACRAAEEPQPP